CRPAGPAYVMIIALAGSCWSSCCSTRNSRERCMARASDSLSPAALDVVIPQAVLVLTLVLTDSLSLVLRESPVWPLREQLVRAEHEQRVPPGLPRLGVAQQVGQRDREVGREHPAPHGAHPPAQGDHAQRAAWQRSQRAAYRRELAQLGFQDPGPLEDHPF